MCTAQILFNHIVFRSQTLSEFQKSLNLFQSAIKYCSVPVCPIVAKESVRCAFVLWPLPSSPDSSLLDGYPELMVSFHPCSLPDHPSFFLSIHPLFLHTHTHTQSNSVWRPLIAARCVKNIVSYRLEGRLIALSTHGEYSPFSFHPPQHSNWPDSLLDFSSPSPRMSQGSSTELYHPTTFDGPHNPFVYFRRLSESLNFKWAGVKGYQAPTLLDH